ncbi:tRNA(adenine(34)) deaminase, chloroplastic isoform X2 [Macadamia integrifolia]|uniref:tRNA(adenine(34)) deaminase, chloroplastic isoform X2 n=1 Tax=Macadamia integrifolia TaxID=60698 RepID=UPI001C4EDBC2|nr:tRNA(adenine(34)) deaminase, chloroplastic isoform X2 [Macadamia integrifolia]
MHNTYCSSAMSLRSEMSLSFSFNDYRYFLNERIEKSLYPPCTCCALSIHGVPIYPRVLYGLRQSSLVHCSVSRRLILVGLPLCDLGRGCYGVSCSLKESSVCRRRRRRRDGRFGCMVWEEKSENCDSGIDGSAEAMLSLLTEELSENFVGRSAAKRNPVEKRGRVVDECYRKEKECVHPKSLQRNSITVKSRENFHKQSGSGRSEASSRTENDGLRREGPRCSSYYSVSSSDDVERDTDGQVKHVEFVGESSSGYSEKESRSSREDVLGVDVRKQFERYDKDVGKYREISRQRNAAGSAVRSATLRSGHKWNLRSKAENKITEVSVGPVESREGSSQRFSRKCDVKESDTKMVASHEMRFSGREENSTSAVNLVKGTTESNSQRGLMVHEHAESRRKSQQVQNMSEIHAIDFQRASSSRKQFSDKEENLTSAVNLVQETGEGNRQTVDETIERTDLGRKSHQLTKVSKDSNTESAYTSQMLFGTGMNVREEHSTSFQSSIQRSEDQQSQIYQGVNVKNELRKESQDLKNMSDMTAGATETTTTTSQTLSGIRVSGRERNSASVLVDLVHEGRQDGSLFGERIIEQVGPRKESSRPVKDSSFPRSTIEMASSSKTPFHSIPQARVQHMGVSTEDDRNSKIMLVPPPPQLVGVRTGNARIQTSGEFSESISSSLFTHPPTQNPASPCEVNVETRTDETFGEHPILVLHDDALGSANHFERSSSQFVGEFLEKVQDEMLTSEIQKERTSSEPVSVYKDMKYIQQGPSQHISQGLQLKRPGSRPSSDVSGSKGPPDEMWDVKDPSLQDSSWRQAPEEGTSTSGSTIVRRTSRSFWSIVRDVVQMRWGTHSETSNSALKSGRRSSSNVSFSSEAWFSGREPDENDDEDVRNRQRGIPKEPISVDQPQLGKASTQSQTEASEATISQDRIANIEADTSSCSGALESGVTCQGPSLASGEVRSGGKETRGRDQGIPSTIAPVDSSLPLPARRFIRSPVIERIPENSRSEVSRIDDQPQLGKASTQIQTEASEATISQDRIANIEADTSSCSGALESGVTCQGPSLASGEVRSGGKETRGRDQGIPSTIAPVDSSLPLPARRFIRSPVIERIPENSRSEVSRIDDQPQLGKASTQIQTEASEATISEDRIADIEAGTASYSGALESGITCQGSSLASGVERSGWKEAGGRDQGIPSTIAPVDSSLPLPARRFIRSPVIERIPESSKAELSRSDVKEHMEQPVRKRLTEVHGTDGKDGELKRREFQRNKQVLKDGFDEWEKAYMLETEQRKVDRMFMREALLEAQRAADIWEVPVGAVLVRNGEIIARGCNLVEELRDSTAHAEMICIREASNQLRTWRLSDTTLYVTLEPCAMCAGAILQSRIDTVVWGAPNKLLGADGSWVRLFPSGGEGGSSSDLTNQPSGPIHPFHPKIMIRRGVLETDCAEVMQQFFHLRRMKKEKKPEEPQPSHFRLSTHSPKFLSKIHDMFGIMFCLY